VARVKTWSARRLALSLAMFLALVALGAWPWPRVALAFSGAYSPVANLFLAGHTFGTRGHARLIPLQQITRKPSDNVTADTTLSFTVDGFQGSLPLGISLRRDVYLPLLIAVALIVSAPLPSRRCLLCLSLAVPVVLAAGIASNGLVAAWTFMIQLRGVYPPAPLTRQLTDLAYGLLLTPPGNRFIAPILLAGGLIGWQALKVAASGESPGC
jgi:hypothetical protein